MLLEGKVENSLWVKHPSMDAVSLQEISSCVDEMHRGPKEEFRSFILALKVLSQKEAFTFYELVEVADFIIGHDDKRAENMKEGFIDLLYELF